MRGWKRAKPTPANQREVRRRSGIAKSRMLALVLGLVPIKPKSMLIGVCSLVCRCGSFDDGAHERRLNALLDALWMYFRRILGQLLGKAYQSGGIFSPVEASP